MGFARRNLRLTIIDCMLNQNQIRTRLLVLQQGGTQARTNSRSEETDSSKTSVASQRQHSTSRTETGLAQSCERQLPQRNGGTGHRPQAWKNIGSPTWVCMAPTMAATAARYHADFSCAERHGQPLQRRTGLFLHNQFIRMGLHGINDGSGSRKGYS
jgi:hypothetical protein